MKKFLFWTAVIVGILAAVALFMKRRSGSDDDSWQGYMEDSKGVVTQAFNDAMSGPDAAEKAKDAVDTADKSTKDVIDLAADTSKDVAAKANRVIS